VAGREGLEAVHEFAASAAVRVRADVRGDEDPVCVHDVADYWVDQARCNAAEVGLAARQQIRAWLSEHDLHALGDQKGRGERKRETHPANVPLPQLPPPDERLGGSSASSRAGDEDHADDEDDAGGGHERDENEEPCWNGLVVLKRVRDVEVDGREGAVVWENVFPAGADCCDGTIDCQSALSCMMRPV
jgi:hypothetical protein